MFVSFTKLAHTILFNWIYSIAFKVIVWLLRRIFCKMYLEVSCVLECSGTELDSTNELIAHVYEQKARPTEYIEKNKEPRWNEKKNKSTCKKARNKINVNCLSLKGEGNPIHDKYQLINNNRNDLHEKLQRQKHGKKLWSKKLGTSTILRHFATRVVSTAE